MPWEEDDGRRIESVEVEGVYVIGERRDSVPSVSESELQRQHAIVLRLADAVPAIIPARFGSLLEDSELAAILRQRKELIRTTLEHLRDNVQMTLRTSLAAGATAESPPASGRDYLNRRRDELIPPVPAHSELLRELRSLILDDRRRSGERGTVTIYHLIRRADIKEYRATVTSVGTPGIAVSGPFAPFAFAPDLFT
jgi:hypothetical protein